MSKQLTIDNVDHELLEEQRKALNRALDDVYIQSEDYKLLQGLESMLDDWSDKNYFLKEN